MVQQLSCFSKHGMLQAHCFMVLMPLSCVCNCCHSRSAAPRLFGFPALHLSPIALLPCSPSALLPSACLQVIVGLVPEQLKRSPNTKMFLRSFWYRATLKGVVHADEMHIYTLARCAPAWQLAALHYSCSWLDGWNFLQAIGWGQWR